MSHLEAVREPVKRMMREGKSTEEVLVYLRSQGCTKAESMWALEDFASLSHYEAKRAVHESKAWADQRESDEALHEQLETELRASTRPRSDGKLEFP